MQQLGSPATRRSRLVDQIDATRLGVDSEADACFDAGRWNDAAARYRASTARSPASLHSWNRLGISLMRAGRPKDAMGALLEALPRFPAEPILYCNLASAFASVDAYAEAVHLCETAHLVAPRDARVLAKLGSMLQAAGRCAEAVAPFARATEIDPRNVDAWHGLASIAYIECRFDEARALFERVASIDPSHCNALANIAASLARDGDFERAARQYCSALARDPDDGPARFGLALTTLALGRYSQGWAMAESRVENPELRGSLARFRRALETNPRWDGAPIPGGSLHLFPEQGLGDFIHFARYLPRLRGVVGEVVVHTPAPLLDLMRAQSARPEFCAVRFVAADDPVAAGDACDLLLSLPFRLGDATDPAAPGHGPYLSADPARLARWADRLGDGSGELKIGLVWAGRAEHLNDAMRSIPLGELAPLLEVAGVRWYSLQKGGAEQRIAELGWQRRIDELGSSLEDFSDSAAVMSELDLVVSVDSAPAHLAGALGVPVWTLLPRAPDWRWLAAGETTHWYRSMTLIRQGPEGRWPDAIQRAARRLATLVARTPAPAELAS